MLATLFILVCWPLCSFKVSGHHVCFSLLATLFILVCWPPCLFWFAGHFVYFSLLATLFVLVCWPLKIVCFSLVNCIAFYFYFWTEMCRQLCQQCLTEAPHRTILLLLQITIWFWLFNAMPIRILPTSKHLFHDSICDTQCVNMWVLSNSPNHWHNWTPPSARELHDSYLITSLPPIFLAKNQYYTHWELLSALSDNRGLGYN